MEKREINIYVKNIRKITDDSKYEMGNYLSAIRYWITISNVLKVHLENYARKSFNDKQKMPFLPP
jgi:hypothetical protein